MSKALDSVVDALDIETFITCSSEAEARLLAEQIPLELGLPHGDIVFLEFKGPGARVRIRSYIHHPGESYRWLKGSGQ